MSEKLSKEDFQNIYAECYEVFTGNIQDEPLEDRISVGYGDFGRNYAMPWIFECIERGMNITKVLTISFPPGDDEVDVEQFVSQVDKWRVPPELNKSLLEEDEEVQVAVDPVAPIATPPEPKVRVARKPRQKSSESLSGRARSIYERLYQENPEIRNADAQRAIASELGIEEKKQLNSIRALVVKFKKNLRG